MRLKRLELVGFKSFAQKTVFDFPEGITAIVGPNGSGKTNVVDAIRWLLGERETKNIRGAKAEDLIFAGTPQRPRMGMAQATMIFDNSSRFFPVDYAEVAITRKVSRDGVSQYLLNNSELRLKDVIDFFAKSRLGTKGLTVIGQGNSDLFVRALPKERRIMLEEILGLRQFQLKKHESERKLQAANFNLEKARAMVDELMPHLRLLRRQTSKWEKQEGLQKELKELENYYFGEKLKAVQDELKELAPKLEAVDRRIESKFKELKVSQEKLKEVENSRPKNAAEFNESKKRQSELMGRKAAIQKELGKLEAQMEFLLSRPKSKFSEQELLSTLTETKKTINTVLLERDLGVIRNLLGNLLKKVENFLNTESEKSEIQKKELEESKNKLGEELGLLDEESDKLRKLEDNATEQLGKFNDVFRGAFASVESKKSEIADLNNQKNKLLFDQERIKIKMREIENQIAQAGRKLSEFQSQELKTNKMDGIENSNLTDIERRVFKLRAEIAGIGDIDESLIKEAQDTEARYNFLSSQLQDLEKSIIDLKTLIKELDDKIHAEFTESLKKINEEFNKYFHLMFGGGRARMRLQKPMIRDIKAAAPDEEVETGGEESDAEHKVDHGGVDIELVIPRKRIGDLEMLSGGEKSLVSIAALFALISVSPPPFLVLDEIDAALDEKNTQRFANLVKEFSKKSQFLLITHNRFTMEVADVLYGVTMGEDGASKVLSLKLE